MDKKPKIFWIDLFAGAGGTSTGISSANKNIEVIACINHDEMAIKSHEANHPDCVHFIEDIRTFNTDKLKSMVDYIRKHNENCLINLWASLECTNYSKAKGGLPRDADSRTLALDMYKYIEAINPDYFYVENVREFMCWGPLCENGKPISKDKGIDYVNWVNTVKSYGYEFDSRLLNSADFGAFTSRERFFAQFAKKGLPISWPKQTHSKNPNKYKGSLFDEDLKPWNAVKNLIDFSDEGKSIFERTKPLSDKTYERILAGCIKFIANGDTSFMHRYNGGNPEEKVKSTDLPLGTILTGNTHAVVQTSFIKEFYSGKPMGKVTSLESPLRTITTVPHQAIVNPVFITKYYGNSNPTSVEEPCHTLTTKDRMALNFIHYHYGNGHSSSLDKPLGSITTNPKAVLVTKKWLVDTQYSRVGRDLEKPCQTLIARMDKKPLYLVSVVDDKEFKLEVSPEDSDIVFKLKLFMFEYGISDIKMRMLKVEELLVIQGFPKDYVLYGTSTDKKKFIGNSVVPIMAKVLAESNYESYLNYLK